MNKPLSAPALTAPLPSELELEQEQEQEQEQQNSPPRARHKRTLLLVVVPLLAALAGILLYLLGGRYVETDNAYVQADKVPVSPEVSGSVSQLLVRENQPVAAGQLLLRLDPRPFQIEVDKAQARLAQVRTDLAALKASYREKQAEITLSHTRSAFANKEQQRQTRLLGKQLISASQFDSAQQTTDLAMQQTRMLEQDLARLAALLGGGLDTPFEQHPNYRAALAELAGAKLDLARSEVRASLTGTVSNLPKPGQYLPAGKMALSLVASANLWIEANFPETDLTHVRPGQPVSIHIDTYPNQQWRGKVSSLSPATGAEFSVLPAQNATGNWVKIVQRVPVRIEIEQDGQQPSLLAGLSSIVAIDTGHRRGLADLF